MRFNLYLAQGTTIIEIKYNNIVHVERITKTGIYLYVLMVLNLIIIQDLCITMIGIVQHLHRFPKSK